MAVLFLAAVCYWFGSGFAVREDVFLVDYAVSPRGSDITLTVGVVSSAGHTRAVKNVSHDPARLELQFYSAFGGFNGSIGAENRFVVQLPEKCREIAFLRGGMFETVLQKTSAGEWQRP